MLARSLYDDFYAAVLVPEPGAASLAPASLLTLAVIRRARSVRGAGR